ncbi:ArsR family transcriptional regulator [Nocardiaceae bacterium YC2-7]|uniref:ArsR family transcriptional regulator n=2 Tax=Antrihabitans stalactiti TaxID=2584121 RepID=A0A848K8A7_9NOCA|nr:ArsR family transcriptional regulator [Antrihabitans stalactiti]NMN95043.1 ArsR family transcriptional regulator [Antrihabitans stalactiti]
MRMAAHPLRWAMLTELSASDLRVRELVAAVGEPQNLVSYHLRQLRSAGFVDVRRSSFDGRDSYYHLDLTRCAAAFEESAHALHPALFPEHGQAMPKDSSVLFLCTGNSARSPMAEALLRHRSDGRVRVASAGSHPKTRVHPNAVRVMRERYGIDLRKQIPKSVAAVSDQTFDHVITLCDKVREVHSPASAHWSLPDPSAAADSDRASYPEFISVATELDTRIRFLLPTLAHPANTQED